MKAIKLFGHKVWAHRRHSKNRKNAAVRHGKYIRLRSWIETAKKSGFSNSEIKKRLEKVGWERKELNRLFAPKIDFIFLFAVLFSVTLFTVLYSGPALLGAFTGLGGEDWENKLEIAVSSSKQINIEHIVFGNFRPASCADGIYVEAFINNSATPINFTTKNEIYENDLCKEADVEFNNIRYASSEKRQTNNEKQITNNESQFSSQPIILTTYLIYYGKISERTAEPAEPAETTALSETTPQTITEAEQIRPAPKPTFSPSTTFSAKVDVPGCTNITSSGTYTMTQAIGNSPASQCIRITASHVIFDCNGFVIDGTDADSSYGINVTDATNVTIRSCYMQDWAQGIYFASANSSTIANSTLTSNTNDAIYLDASHRNTIVNNTANNNPSNGITLTASANNTVLYNTANSNLRAFMIQTSSNNSVFENNTANSNTGQGFTLSGGSGRNSFINNTLNGNSFYGISITSSNDNIWVNNTARSNAVYDYFSQMSTYNNTVINLDVGINRTITFESFDVGVTNGSLMPGDPAGFWNITRYINATNNSANSFLFLNFSYLDSDLAPGVSEASLRMFMYSGKTSAWVTRPANFANTSGVNVADNYVFANITSFGVQSIFAPFGIQTNINICTNITEPENYTLTAGITNSGLTQCMRIMASNTTLNCQGNTIDGTDSSTTYGINATGVVNATIKNCAITDWDAGIYFELVNSSMIVNNSITSSFSVRGIDIAASDRNTIVNNTLANGPGNLRLQSGSSNTIINNTFNATVASTSMAISGDYSVIANNTVRNSGLESVILGVTTVGTVFLGNTIRNSSTWDFLAQAGSSNTTAIGLDIGPIISFVANDIAIKNGTNGSTITPPANYFGIGKFINITNVSGNSFIFINISYLNGDLGSVDESSLNISRYNGTWETAAHVFSNISQFGVVTANNYVFANITNFGGLSTFAPLGTTTDTTPPAVTNIAPTNITTFGMAETVNISASITDSSGVGAAIAAITHPGGALQNITLTLLGGSTYNRTFFNTTINGTYTARIIANDTAGNTNSTVTTSFIISGSTFVDAVGLNFTLEGNRSTDVVRVPQFGVKNVLVENGSFIIARLVTDFSINGTISLSSISAAALTGPDIKSVLYRSSYPNNITRKDLFIPAVDSNNALFVCPVARSFAEVNESCIGKYSAFADIVVFGGRDYLVLTNISGTGAQAVFDWPMFKQNLRHTGFVNISGPTTSALLWNFTTGLPIEYSSPAVANGIVYFGSDDNKTYALNASNGTHIWNFTGAGGFGFVAPAVANGIVYIGTDFGFRGQFYALNASNGSLIWNRTMPALETRSSPAVANNFVYFGLDDNNLYALNASNGAYIWNFTTSDVIRSSPAVANNIVYFGSNDGQTRAVNASNGTLIWNRTMGAVISSPAIANNIVYIGSGDNNIYALNATNGTLIWNLTLDSSVRTTPSIAFGRVYVGTNGINLTYALNATNGTQIWNFSAGNGFVDSSLIVSNNSIVYFGNDNGTLFAINATTGTHIWNYTAENYIRTTPALAMVGTREILFFGSGDNRTYAIVSNNLPGTPALFNPSNDSLVTNLTPVLNWTIPADTDGDTLHFQLQIANDSAFTQLAVSASSATDTAGFVPTPPLAQNSGNASFTVQSNMDFKQYFWRVRAHDGKDYGPYSSVFQFNVTTSVACDISLLNVSFGSSINPLTTTNMNSTANYAGFGNGTTFNVTSTSNVAINITHRATNMSCLAGECAAPGLNERISAENISWTSNTSIANGSNMLFANRIAMQGAFDNTNKIATNMQSTTTAWLRFWLTTRGDQGGGNYTGTYTARCVQA